MDVNEQLWFFRFEKQGSADFKQIHKSWQEVIMFGVSLKSTMSILNLDAEDREKFNFYIFSPSMKAAVQLLNDRSLYVTWQLYCQQDSTVEVIVRPLQDASPNSSRCPSSHASLVQRRKVSDKRNLSDIFIRPAIEPISENLDVGQMVPTKTLEPELKVVLDLGGGKSEVFSKEYLLGWIRAEIENGKSLEDIVVTSVTPKGRPIETQLTKDIWIKSLLRGAWKEDFQEIWSLESERQVVKLDALHELNDSFPSLENNARVFLQDLKQFGSNQEARNRLLGSKHPFFLGAPYFSDDAVTAILRLPIGHGTFEASLNDLLAKKKERGHSDEICASHDLAPLVERVFGIQWAAVRKMKNLKLESANAKPLKRRSTKGGTLRMGTLRRMLSRARLE